MHDSPLFGRFAGIISRHAVLVIGLLMMVAGGLMASAPNLEELALTHGSPMMPTNTQSAAALKHMAKAFGESESNNTAAVVVVKDQPFTEQDRRFRAELMKKLRADTAHVEPGMDMWSDPQFATASESPDKKVALAQLQLAGEIGGPKAMESAKAVQRIIDDIEKPPGTTIYATGTSQAAADQINTMMRDVVIIGGLSLVLVGGLLLLVYRSLVVAFLPLITVGVAVGIATPIASFLTLAGLIPTSMMTNALMGALALGAGTDYSIFFIGRYQEGRRCGLSVDDAFRASYRGVAPVVIASGLTVAGALSCMTFAQLDMMKSMGIPGAITMIFTVLSAVTVTPGALLIGARRFGWFEPRSTARSTRLWRRVGIRVARWPRPIFVTTFAALILLMMVIPTASFNYDELQFIPKDMPSAAGMHAIQEHFPAGQMNPDMILIRAPEDLRSSANIGLLEKAAQQITKLDSVASVQWITRPTGMPMDQTSLMYSVGMAGTMMSQNKIVMEQRQQRMHAMTDDMNSMMSTLQGLQGTLRTAQQGAKQFSAAAQPIQSSLNQLKSQLNSAMGPVREAVRAQPNCAADPMCVGAQSTLSNFENMSSVTDQMRSLVSTSGSMTGGLTQAARTMPRMLESMSSMQDLMTETNEQMTQMMSQIDTMTSLMQDLGRSSAGTGDYFYFPAQMLSDPRFKPYLKMMFSEDGTTTRMIVIGSGSSYGDEGIQRVRDLAHEMKYALKGTRLEGSVIEIAGPAALIGDMRVMLDRDEKLIMIGCLTVIFTVVLLLLRGLVASLIVIGSVLVSFASTLGLALVIWQHVLGIQLHWSVPVAVFAILISVGADYNLLVASRFKEEMSAGIRTGVIRAIAGTGGVVTTAGLVFAMTQFAMMGSSLINIAQMGSTIGLGLIIDTFVVRTFTVPTLAVILDKKFWWPLPMNQLWRRS
ncbi:RND family transporter [Mycobacteroides chelonae]|uniref:MMPL/RND family transporter n=1 Tax=Mycobacteroides chelonae TaxID=1774 RepID=UPI0008AA59BD|nr:RND family transporter [Mycobacteroides chelonae]OHU41837.1 hypothetical protein BKG78_09320 [Mycobacteroides chelonae]